MYKLDSKSKYNNNKNIIIIKTYHKILVHSASNYFCYNYITKLYISK